MIKKNKGKEKSNETKCNDSNEIASQKLPMEVIEVTTAAITKAIEALQDLHAVLASTNHINHTAAKKLSGTPVTKNEEMAVANPHHELSPAQSQEHRSSCLTSISSKSASHALTSHSDWVPPLPLRSQKEAGVPAPPQGISPAAAPFAFQVAPINGRSNRPFQSEHRRVLERCSFATLGRLPRENRWVTLPFAVSALAAFLSKHYMMFHEKSASSSSGKNASRMATMSEIIQEARSQALHIVARAPVKVSLPPPPAVVSVSGAISVPPSKSNATPTILVALSSLSFGSCTTQLKYEAPTENDFLLQLYDEKRQPRCARNGCFFETERLVDQLMEATEEDAQHLKNNGVSSSPSSYWITADHPQIQGGYVKLLPTARPVHIDYSAVVFPAHRLLTRDGKDQDVIHSSYLGASTSKQKRQPGMNIFTGQVSSNTFFQQAGSLFHGGAVGWFTLEQALSRGCAIKAATPEEKKAVEDMVTNASSSFDKRDTAIDDPLCLDGGVFVTLKEHIIYNASWLERPGRLGRTSSEAEIPMGKDGVWDPNLDSDGRLFRSV